MTLRSERAFERIKRMAAANGGLCLSVRYRGTNARYRMRCAKGHEWFPRGTYITMGHWCAECRRTGRPPAYTIVDVRQAASARGGRLLSTRYRRVREKLDFECAAGHRFRTPFSKVIAGYWCRKCAQARQRLGIDAAIDVAERRGGRCLSTQYLNTRQNLDWECAKGHRWRATLSNVRRGTWCPHCNRPRCLTLDDMQQVARIRGGKCLSQRYKNNTSDLRWECATGHQWRATPKNVRQHGTWCPECARGMSAAEIERRRKALRALGRIAGRLVTAAGKKAGKAGVRA